MYHNSIFLIFASPFPRSMWLFGGACSHCCPSGVWMRTIVFLGAIFIKKNLCLFVCFFPHHNFSMKKEVSLPRWKWISLKQAIFMVQKVTFLATLAWFYLLHFHGNFLRKLHFPSLFFYGKLLVAAVKKNGKCPQILSFSKANICRA